MLGIEDGYAGEVVAEKAGKSCMCTLLMETNATCLSMPHETHTSCQHMNYVALQAKNSDHYAMAEKACVHDTAYVWLKEAACTLKAGTCLRQPHRTCIMSPHALPACWLIKDSNSCTKAVVDEKAGECCTCAFLRDGGANLHALHMYKHI